MTKKIKTPITKRICKVALIISPFIIISLILFLLVAKAYYQDYYANSIKEFEVPGLNDNFVTQGLEYIAEHDAFLISGYLSHNGETRIYVVNKDDSYREISVKLTDGSCFKSHAGGISSYEEFAHYVYTNFNKWVQLL